MKRQRLNRKILYIILCLVVVSIASITLAYAALSSALNISGSTEVTGSTWNITIGKVNLNERYPNSIWTNGTYPIDTRHEDNALVYQTAKMISAGVISNNSVNNMQFSVAKPGDGVAIVYEVTNNGTIPAIFESGMGNQKSITSATNNTTDIELIANYFEESAVLVPTKCISADGWTIDNCNALEIGDVLCPGETAYLLFFYEFENSATAVPSSNVTISNLGATLNFVQADKSTCIES